MEHIDNNILLPDYHSAYRQNHGTETAFLQLHNESLFAMNKKKVSIVVLIDLSAAFDTVDHKILLDVLAKCLQ